MTVDTVTSLRELDSRVSCGMEVRLLWCQGDGRVWVAVQDAGSGESFRLEVLGSERPLEVFRHPYAYAAHHHVDTRDRTAAPDKLIRVTTTR